LKHPAGPILVATDFSDGSAAAVREARSLAAALDAEVIVLHVAGAALWQPDGAVAAWLARVGMDPGGMTLRFGVPWAQIVRCAVEVGACMVAVGSHGRTGFHPLAPGSTAAQLLTRCPVPVLVVAGRGAAAEGVEPHES
jgi:nucleotide-binding universal stress UspA family protein